MFVIIEIVMITVIIMIIRIRTRIINIIIYN